MIIEVDGISIETERTKLMRISEIQAQLLFQTLHDSLQFDKQFVVSLSTREGLYKEIIEQQKKELVELEQGF